MISAVLSYHSLEDREVKEFMYYCAGKQKIQTLSQLLQQKRDEDVDDTEDDDKNFSSTGGGFKPSMEIVNLRPNAKFLGPTDKELKSNPRSGSAKLRVAAKLDTAPVGASWKPVR